MYVTRRRSQLLKYPETLSTPPEGPNSGYLVIQDEQSEAYSCCGSCMFCWNLSNLPFPQNMELTLRYSFHSDSNVTRTPVFLIPVLNQPLSSNRYYAIVRHGQDKGEAFTCSTEDDIYTSCFCRHYKELGTRPLDPDNIYQQFQIVPYQALMTKKGWTPKGDFFANSIATDGIPPYPLRQRGWTVYAETPDNFTLETAHGLDSNLRSRLPGFDFSVSEKSSKTIVVGKWYCPFMFVKEGKFVGSQMRRSMYYEMTLEQRWEQIFTCKKNIYEDPADQNSVLIDALIEKEEVFVGGIKALWNERNVVDGVIWFTSYGPGRKPISVGLRVEIVERMKWEQERGGWIGGEERQVKINKVKEFKETDRKWTEFGCYVLVERFNLKRMDGSLVMSYDFKHCLEMRAKWE